MVIEVSAVTFYGKTGVIVVIYRKDGSKIQEQCRALKGRKQNTNEEKRDVPIYLSDAEIPLWSVVSDSGSSDAQDDLALFYGRTGRSSSDSFFY